MMQEWLNTYPQFHLFTNQEMLDNPEYRYEGWFNPFTEPDKLVEELKNFRTGKEVREHLEEFYPGINAEKYAQKKIDENKAREIKYCCSTFRWKWNPQKNKYVQVPKRCKHWNDCPLCKAYKIQLNKDRLDNLWDYRVITVEDEIKTGSKSNYLRIPRNDGTTTYILNEKPQNDSETMNYELYNELALDMLPNEKRGRFSGNFGKLPVVVQDPDKDKPSVQVNNFLVRFTDESTIKSNRELENIIMPQIVSATMPLLKDAKNLQAITDIAEKVLDKACQEYNIDKQFLYTETIYIDVDKINWNMNWKIPMKR